MSCVTFYSNSKRQFLSQTIDSQFVRKLRPSGISKCLQRIPTTIRRLSLGEEGTRLGKRRGSWHISPHHVPCCIRMPQKYTLSQKKFAKIHCFMRTLKDVPPHDTLSHNFLINSNTLSHNFYQKRTPCRITSTVKGHPIERHIP